MTFRRMTGAGLAAGLIASLIGGAAAFAAPAHADDTTTADFLSALGNAGITGVDPAQAVELGQSICPMLADRSQNTADIASTVSDALGRPLGPATMFTGIAVSFFCPRAMQDLANGQSPIPLDLLNNFGF
ncbi:DUF732 domain-containing protein [Mycolicibacterium sp. CBM1]